MLCSSSNTKPSGILFELELRVQPLYFLYLWALSLILLSERVRQARWSLRVLGDHCLGFE